MKTLLIVAMAAAVLLVGTESAAAQSRTNRIYRTCSAVTTKARVEIDSDGDILISPCAGRLFMFDRTVTAAATVGAQTINKPVGTVNFAAAAASLVVTNSGVSVNSIIFPVIRTADATCTFVKSVVSGSGTFTITMNAACTAETSVGFLVTN